MSYLDLNNDGVEDMVVSTFDPSLVKSENINNIWLYENVGATNDPQFELTTQSFLQNEMLDFGAGAYPAFFDYNNDGLQDLVVGNYGYLDSSYYGPGLNLYCTYSGRLALLRNTGTSSQPQYQLADTNFASIPANFTSENYPYALVPAFGDLDGDGDSDMLLGNAQGNLLLYENTAAPGTGADFVLTDENFQNISVAGFSAPQLFDLNDDGLNDLVIGKRNGTISYYENTGTAANPEFTLVSDSLGKVDVRNPNLSIFGFCVPHFFKDGEGTIHLFAGSEFGEIHYYTEIENNLAGEFKLVMKNYLWIDEGLYSAVAVADLNNDGLPDMVVGNYSGGLSWFEGTTPPPENVSEIPAASIHLRVFPNPAMQFISIQTNIPDGEIAGYKVMDMTGKVVLSGNLPSTGIDVSMLKNGIYLVSVFHDARRGTSYDTEKLIIQR
jgi:hypothetical protein